MVKKALPHKPLIVKLSPNVEDITATARGTMEGGADTLSLVNTFTGRATDISKRRPRLANVTGGLSGPAIKPIALHLVSRVYRNVAKSAGVPIIGMGGVQYWQDAVEFILAGSSAVAIGTALFVDPATPNKICDGLRQYLERMKISRLSGIMDAVFALGEATVNKVVRPIPSPTLAIAVRRMMPILGEKGFLRRRQSGRVVVYFPRQAKGKAGRDAFEQVLETFFGGSLEEAL